MPLIINIPLLFSLFSSVHSLCSAELVDAEVTSKNPCLDPVKQYQYPVAGADLHARVTNESVSSVHATQVAGSEHFRHANYMRKIMPSLCTI